LRGSNTTHQIYICRKLLQSPCVCCGKDHPEAEIVKDDKTNEEYGRYTCEVSKVLGKSFSNAVMEDGQYRHIPCPRLFALRNGYQLNDIRLAWDTFMEKGYGHCIPYRRLRMLWEEILTICEEERASWTFTRDLRWKPPGGKDPKEEMIEVDDMDIEEGQDPKDYSTKWEPAKSNF
jgi:hypothetical protein